MRKPDFKQVKLMLYIYRNGFLSANNNNAKTFCGFPKKFKIKGNTSNAMWYALKDLYEEGYLEGIKVDKFWEYTLTQEGLNFLEGKVWTLKTKKKLNWFQKLRHWNLK